MYPTSQHLIRLGASTANANRYADAIAEAAIHYHITTPDRCAAWLANIFIESGSLARVEENMNYTTAARLVAVFPSRFKTLGAAQPYVRNPVALANLVYGGRYGNRNPGDGWRYRGRGLIQTTFRDNYREARDFMRKTVYGVPDFVEQPELLAEPKWAAWSAGAYWAKRNLNAYADDGKSEAITRAINPAMMHWRERKELTRRARLVLA